MMLRAVEDMLVEFKRMLEVLPAHRVDDDLAKQFNRMLAARLLPPDANDMLKICLGALECNE